MKLKLDSLIEWAYVFLVSAFLLYIGMAVTMNYRLIHSFPYGFSASDAFGEIAYTEGIKDLGDYKFLPYYIRYGFSDTLGFHMPMFNHIAAIFSYVSGLPVWDSLLIIGFLFSIFSLLAMYSLIRNFNRNIALIGIALAVFLYERNFSIIYTWGQWDLIMATFFLISAVWVLDKFEIKYSYILFALLASGVALTHISEAIFLLIFTILFFVLKLLRKKLSSSDFKKLIISGILALIFSFYYLLIFKVGYGAGGVDNSIKYQAPERFDVVLSQFGLFQFLIMAGLLVALILLFAGIESTALLFGSFMFFIGYTNFISSFAPRAFQTRYLWPIHLPVLIGALIYFKLKFIIKEWKVVYSIAISLILAVSITLVYYQKTTNSGIINEQHWGALNWISQNTPKDAKLVYFYGDPYNQEAILWNQKRVSYRVNMEDFVNAIKEGKVKREYNVEVAAADDAELLYSKGAFSFGYHYREINKTAYFGQNDICKFDYFVFDKVGSQQALIGYNAVIANDLIKSGIVQPVFDNGVVLILKNNEPGGNCVEERNL
ncbi:hypothetical protein HYX02_01225 [Candidatus Woesearchaeota archaeon]|nr:hypothetical protein [Candidatus Woesearchaeota archaeon]